HGHTPLGEVLGDELRSGAPSDNVDKIGLLFAGLPVGAEVAIHGQGEGSHRDTAAGTAQLGVTGEPTHENDVVQHAGTSLHFHVGDEGAHHAFGDLEHAVELSGELGLGVKGHEDVVAFHQIVDGVGQ